MLLSALLQAVPIDCIEGKSDVEVAGLTADSRAVRKGFVFVAVEGSAVDGHQYINSALEQGASVVICQRLPETEQQDVTLVQTSDTAEALGLMASAWYGHPSDELTLVGVTGTNGKTTIATLLYHLFQSMGEPSGLLSTVCNYVDRETIPATHTTPDALTLNALLRRMVDAGCRYAFMEVSSHAVDQRRIAGLTFDGGIFTNLTRDHLDYHKTFDLYLKAKKRFFDDLPPTAFALSNKDDRNGAVMLQNTVARKRFYSVSSLADFKARVLEDHLDGMLLEINDREMAVPFVGRFNAYNLLAVAGTAVSLGKDPDEVLCRLSELRPVSGRFETIRSEKKITVVVDYAHTPDALTNVLTTLREVMREDNNLITVVGAGGNRDKGKRPIMAAEAAKYSDRVILTSDNPRFEEPQAILNDMIAGLNREQNDRTLVIEDRRQAIRTAVMLAGKGDVVLIAGKGHEEYQEIQGVKHHFDDKEEVKRALEGKN